jgi:hypothetical protein
VTASEPQAGLQASEEKCAAIDMPISTCLLVVLVKTRFGCCPLLVPCIVERHTKVREKSVAWYQLPVTIYENKNYRSIHSIDQIFNFKNNYYTLKH